MAEAPDDVIEIIESEEEDSQSPIPVFRIRSYPSDPDLETLHGRWGRGEIEIPPFQRGFVWRVSQASRLIESFLMGLPVPGIFVFLDDDERQVVIDGQQRLTSIFAFFDGKLPSGDVFRLRGVDPRWEGKSYTSLENIDRTRLLHSILRVIIVEPSPTNSDESICQIFERLNTGGTTLTPQEIRNSTFRGPFNNMVLEINNDPNWRKLFGTTSPDPRMRDIELIVRFFALLEESVPYTKPMKGFLNDFMKRHKKDPDTPRYRALFEGSASRVFKALGERPFHLRRGINAATYDATMVAFAAHEAVPHDISQRYDKLVQDAKFIADTTAATTDVDTVNRRLRFAKAVLFG